MSNRKRRTFTKEQKADAVNLIRSSGDSIPRIAIRLGIHENSLRRWIAQADIDEGRGPEGALTTEEKAEIRRLKREMRQLKMENEFLKKTAESSIDHCNT